MITMEREKPDVDEVDQARLDAVVRDVVRVRHSRADIVLMAHRRGWSVARLERHLGLEHLRELAAHGIDGHEGDAGQGETDLAPQFIGEGPRKRAIERKRAELVKEFGESALMFHLGRRMSIDDLAASLVDHGEEA